MTQIVISGTGLFTPPYRITNEELVDSFNQYVRKHNADNADAIARGDIDALNESSAEFVKKASGINARRVLDRDGILDIERMCPELPRRSNDEQSIQCEMAVAASKQALDQAGLEPADIDAVLVACSNMQRPYPAMAIEVQAALGIDGWGYDMNVACASATFGVQTAADAVRAGNADRVLMVNPEICSAHLNYRDRDSHFIFGDVCTAVIVERAEGCRSTDAWEVLGTRLSTKFSNNIRNNFGFLNRTEKSDRIEPGSRNDRLFVQEGRKVFKEVVPLVVELISSHLAESNIDSDDLKRMWLHQANLSMNHLISKRLLGREPSETEAPVVLDEYANTSSAGSIIAFHQHRGDLVSGDLGVICAFGAGYSAGNVIVRKR